MSNFKVTPQDVTHFIFESEVILFLLVGSDAFYLSFLQLFSCPNLHILKANGCKNINGSNLRHEALIHLDAAHNLDGIHMDIYIFYKVRGGGVDKM